MALNISLLVEQHKDGKLTLRQGSLLIEFNNVGELVKTLEGVLNTHDRQVGRKRDNEARP
jgi:hypothetical protein